MNTRCFSTLAAILLLACTAPAATLVFSVAEVRSPGDINNEGVSNLAINAGGDPVTVNGIDFSGPGFGFDPPVPPFDAQWAASGDNFYGGFFAGIGADARLDQLFANAYVGIGARELTLGPLAPGAPYRLQLLIGDDSLAPRAFAISLLGQTLNFSRSLTDPAQVVIAEFTAISATATVTFTQAPGGEPIVLNAVALHLVPEPASALLVALGSLAILARRSRRTVAALFVLLVAPPASEAGLDWERPLQEFRSTPAEEKVSATFHFKNTGTSPVTIASVRSSCGCTTATLDKRHYAPGENGEIVAEFRFGGRKGLQEKTVTVTTDDKDAPLVSLRLRVAIEETLSVQPTLVFWRVGEVPEPKRIELRAAPGHPVRVQGVESASAAFKARVETVEQGRHYVLIIEPASTAARTTATLKIATDAAPTPTALQAFAIVR